MQGFGIRRWLVPSIACLVVPFAALAQDAETKVETCSKSFGTLAVAEPNTGWGHLSRYGLGSPSTLLRMMVQQSGCFDVVERGVGMQNLQQERALAQSGELMQGSNIGQGQMQGADFVMTPVVQIAATETGGIGALGGALLGRLGPLASLAGGLKFKEAETSLLIADVRSSIQVAAAEGKATKTEFNLGAIGIGGGMLGAIGGYGKTPEGKVVAASFLDNYNRIVASIRDKPQLIRPASESAQQNAANSTRAEAPQAAGQMLQARIANVRVYAEPSRESTVVATLQRTDELVASGEARNGFIYVDSANFSGWVQRTLVGPAPGAAPAAVVRPAVVVTPAPAVRTVPSGSIVSMAAFADFNGTYDGAEAGQFRVNVSGKGIVTGAVMTPGGQLGVMGRLDEDGTLVFMANGADGSRMFMGRFDPTAGRVTGSWKFGSRDAGGSFNGGRQ